MRTFSQILQASTRTEEERVILSLLVSLVISGSFKHYDIDDLLDLHIKMAEFAFEDKV